MTRPSEHYKGTLDMGLLWEVIKLSFPFKALLLATIVYSVLLALIGPLRPELIQQLIAVLEKV